LIDTGDGKSVTLANMAAKAGVPVAMAITHWHEDHVVGLSRLDDSIPLYAPLTEDLPPAKKDRINPATEFTVGQIYVRSYPVVHTGDVRLETRAYVIQLESAPELLVYASDVRDIALDELREILKHCAIYIGDGASLSRVIGSEEYGHAPIVEQLEWVSPDTRVIFTHVGKWVQNYTPEQVAELFAKMRPMGEPPELAIDGWEINLHTNMSEMSIDAALKADPRHLDKQELLALHLRCHQLYGKWSRELDAKLEKLHNMLAAEIVRRGLRHSSELTR
jgi:hypothetical protein